MSWLSVAAARFRGLFTGARVDRELNDEVRFHVEMQTEENLKAGMGPEEARYAALRSFGAVTPMRETYRELSTVAAIETTVLDFRFAMRTLWKSPAFSITSIAVLALAIGANTAMFSVLNAVLLRPLPYQTPDQLTMLWREVPAQGVREGRWAFRNIEFWQRQSQSLADIAFFDPISATLTSAGNAEHISANRVSPNYFVLLGVQPQLGRTFTVDEAERRERLAVISHQFWQSHFNGSPNAIGATIAIDGLSSRIIGVMPASFQLGTGGVSLWEPHTLFPDWETVRASRGGGSWFVMARLKDGATIPQAQAEFDAISHRIDGEMSIADRGSEVRVVALSHQLTGTEARRALWMLAGAVLFVLLIAATNIASLTLARSASREREIEVRAALGANRGRIIRQLLVESISLACVSGALALLVAHTCIQVIRLLNPGELARLQDAALDLPVLGFAAGLCLATGILVGLAPALTMARRSMRLSSRGVSGGMTIRHTRQSLVVLQFSLAIVLLAGAGLLIRSLQSAGSVELGYRPERILVLQGSTPSLAAGAQRTGYYNRVIAEIQSLPGVETAAVIGDFFVGSSPDRPIILDGGGLTNTQNIRYRTDETSEGFFQLVGAPLLSGRLFTAADGPSSPRVAIVNKALAHRAWAGQDPLGKRFKLSPGDLSWYTVVGVVGDMRREGLENEPIPQIFEPMAQNPSRRAEILVRTSSSDPSLMAGAVQAAVHAVDKNVPVFGVMPLRERLNRYLAQRQFQTWLLTGFSAISLLIAAIGIYGLIQYSIATRKQEIGIRMAIGAQASEIFGLIIGEGMKLAFAGLAIGLAGALWLGNAASSMLYGVTATDPLTFVSVSLLLIVVAVTACYFPARRAMKIDPITALRAD